MFVLQTNVLLLVRAFFPIYVVIIEKSSGYDEYIFEQTIQMFENVLTNEQLFDIIYSNISSEDYITYRFEF